jgi:parallel beta-helix repeat protein
MPLKKSRFAWRAIFCWTLLAFVLPAALQEPSSSDGPRDLIVSQDSSGGFSSIQAAIDAARPGDAVLARPGVYREHLVFKSGIRLAGYDAASCIIEAVSSEKPLLLAQDCSEGIIEKLTFEGREFSQGVFIKGASALTVADCVVQNTGSSCILVSGPGAKAVLARNVCRGSDSSGISFDRGATGLAEENLCEENSYGIQVTNDLGEEGMALPKTNPILRNNICRGNPTGIQFFSNVAGIAEQNLCENNTAAGIEVMEKGAEPMLRGNQCLNNYIGIAFSFGALGSAVENECHNNEEMGIGVHGEGTAPLLERNNCQENENGISASSGATLKANDNACLYNKSTGIYVSDSRGQLKRNSCYYNNVFGIMFSEGATGEALENICREKQNMGISVDGENTYVILSRNQCLENTLTGIAISTNAEVKADENNCSNNLMIGIAVIGPNTKADLYKNTVSNNNSHGINYARKASGDINNNFCLNNGKNGIYVERESSVTARNNECTGNTSSGIEFSSVDTVEARNNICTNNKHGIIILGEGAKFNFQSNNCSENKIYGIAMGNGAVGSAEKNRCDKNGEFGIAISGIKTKASLKENKYIKNKNGEIALLDGAQ